MLDVRSIRADVDAVRAAVARRGDDTSAVDRAAALDAELRSLTTRRDALRAEIRTLSNEVGKLFRDKRQEEATEMQAQSKLLGQEEKDLDARATELEVELREVMLRIPNMPSEECTDGVGENDNVVVRVENFDEESYAPHQRVTHCEIVDELLILDVYRAVKLSGSMFVMYVMDL